MLFRLPVFSGLKTPFGTDKQLFSAPFGIGHIAAGAAVFVVQRRADAGVFQFVVAQFQGKTAFAVALRFGAKSCDAAVTALRERCGNPAAQPAQSRPLLNQPMPMPWRW